MFDLIFLKNKIKIVQGMITRKCGTLVDFRKVLNKTQCMHTWRLEEEVSQSATHWPRSQSKHWTAVLRGTIIFTALIKGYRLASPRLGSHSPKNLGFIRYVLIISPLFFIIFSKKISRGFRYHCTIHITSHITTKLISDMLYYYHIDIIII